MHYTVFTWRKKKRTQSKGEDWWRKWGRCVILRPEMPPPPSVLTCTCWCQEKVFNHHLRKMQLCHCCAAVWERDGVRQSRRAQDTRHKLNSHMYSGLRLCAKHVRRKTIYPEGPVVYPCSIAAGAWAGDHHRPHHPPIVTAFAGSSVQQSKSSNQSLSPSGLGEESWPASPTQTGGAPAEPCRESPIRWKPREQRGRSHHIRIYRHLDNK